MIGNKLQENENLKPNSLEIRKLKETFPQYFNNKGEFKIDKFKDFLKQEEVEISKEGYELKFLGKSYAKYLSSLETETYISPDVEHNSKEENINSENLYIVGDNIDALKHLLSSYAGKIKCIYIDPPYNTGSDGFVYPDNFQFNPEELSKRIGITEEEAGRILELAGKSTHSAWLTFMYPRLVLARDLLSEDGVIFISIDDNEQANLKLICDEIFGEENFVGKFNWTRKKKGAFLNKKFRVMTENIMLYQKSDFEGAFFGERAYSDKKQPIVKRTNSLKELIFPNDLVYTTLKDGSYPANIAAGETEVTFLKPFEVRNGKIVSELITKARYIWTQDFLNDEIDKGTEIYLSNQFGFNVLRSDQEDKIKAPSDIIDSKLNVGTNEDASSEIAKIFNTNVGVMFDYAKPVSLIIYLINMITYNQKDSIILDFFSGSATTAHATMQLNSEDKGQRKYIMVQLPEEIEENKPAYKAGYKTIDQIGRARIEKAAQKIKEETNADIDYGYKLYYLATPEEKTLMELESFEPEIKLITDDMVSVFDNDHSSGKESILATWLNEDGYGLTMTSLPYKLETYQANLMDKSLYIIDEGLEDEDVMTLIKRIEDETLDITRVVVYVHSVRFSVLQELRKNLKVLRNNKNVTLIERF
ncbi:MAG: site-specific DNA-methyltransferase [Epulopiscium sp.]|nr:site-specific DNA-methyltransferase [Candidatus Epulonipiscium sp.]